MALLNKLLDGFRLLGATFVTPRSYRIERAGFAADEKNMATDFFVVGSDWANALNTLEQSHGKANPRQSPRYSGKSSAIGAARY